MAKDETSDTTFTWRYLGHGKWSIPGYEDRLTWQIAEGKLLELSQGPFGKSKFVFDRQN